MKLDPDEKELLESFERGEWASVEGDRAAVRDYGRHQLPIGVKSDSEVIARDTEPSRHSASGR